MNKLLLPALVLSLLLMGGARAGAAATAAAKIEPAVLAATKHGAATEFLVVLAGRADLSRAATATDKTARGRLVYSALTAQATADQAPLRAWLAARGVPFRAYWVVNMLWVRGDRGAAQWLAARPEVAAVRANTQQRVGPPTTAVAPLLAAPQATAGIEWNIALVGAPAVWAAGYTGVGAVVGGQDTGYDWEHPALKGRYRGWNGATADHNYNWHDAIHEDFPQNGSGNTCGFDSPVPCDDSTHGTHTMGTMVGSTAESGIGMAPGASWIGCRNMEDGWGSPATYAECYEWFIAPYPFGGDPFTDGDPARAPHVINNSWGCPPAEGCAAPDVLRAVVETVRAAGILTVHSAGNSGPGCQTIDDPAAIYDASFTAGATDSDDDIVSFSSRGPIAGRRAPDIVAPGFSVRSSLPGNSYGSLSGTSMAAPHVAGLVALLVSADPGLAGQVEEVEMLITSTAVPQTSNQGCGDDTPTSVPNNVYGWGRIDALAAFEAIELPSLTEQVFVPALAKQ